MEKRYMRQKYSVAVYLCNRAYGGPEEGGWWYNYGELHKLVRVFTNGEAAYMFANRMNTVLDRFMNKGRHPLSSILCQGRYYAEVYEGMPPQHYPQTRPYYE